MKKRLLCMLLRDEQNKLQEANGKIPVDIQNLVLGFQWSAVQFD